ncbi:T-cell surface protein tactile isoform X1 [Carcharodon carcharias]|uniref:T-cell surface protein tactile isoform X1 n=1 Tax=Carcharodon carcharias TaxID=13397 RepID=UPI001B7E80DE|nr:T-cell surface protein tactile isoform X1 [Carcharodon carcharias]
MKTMATQAKHGHPPLCLFVVINLVQALQGLSIEHDRAVATSPGENITLKCILQGKQNTAVVQIQWSKETNNNSNTFIVANHRFGTFQDMKSVKFESQLPTNGTGSIHFTNVQVSDSGTYTCSFVTFPTGSLKVSTILTVVKEVISPIALEVMLNSKIQLPCGFNIPAKHDIRLTWFKKSNGTFKKLFHSNGLGIEINNSSQYKDRIQLDANYSLEINPVLAVDDGDFICQVVTLHGQETNITTKVYVFAEPMSPQIHGELNYFPLNKLHLNATCISQEAYPEPNITFYLDEFPQDGDNDSVTVSEVFQDSNGFYDVKKRLSIELKADQWRFVWCDAVFSLPGNKSRVIQSKKISLNNYLSNIEFTPEGPYEVFLEDALNISCHVNCSVIPRYRWTKVNGTVSNSNLLILKNITEETAGMYICDANIPGTNLHHSSYINVTIKDPHGTSTGPTVFTSDSATNSTGIESYTNTDLTTSIQLSIATGSSTISGDSTSTEVFTSAGLSTTMQSSETVTALGPSTSIASSSSTRSPVTIELSTSETQHTTIQSSTSFELTNSTKSSMEDTKISTNNTKSYTTMNYFNQTSTIGNHVTTKDSEDTVSVAVVVTVILILVICTAVLSYLIRHWQVRKKLNGPPPFKPPPPPIKYTAIQVSPQGEVN